jgi:hypothetical protein
MISGVPARFSWVASPQDCHSFNATGVTMPMLGLMKLTSLMSFPILF